MIRFVMQSESDKRAFTIVRTTHTQTSHKACHLILTHDLFQVERYAHESSQKYHLENPYWQTYVEQESKLLYSPANERLTLVTRFDKYVVPLLDKPMDLRRLNELDTSKEVRVEHDQGLWENVKKHQSQS